MIVAYILAGVALALLGRATWALPEKWMTYVSLAVMAVAIFAVLTRVHATTTQTMALMVVAVAVATLLRRDPRPGNRTH